MRASLLLNCSRREAQEVRKRAGLQHRTVSGYVIHIVLRVADFEEKLTYSVVLGRIDKRPSYRPRTTLHISCSHSEAERIRDAANRRSMTISGFVLSALWRSWIAEDELAKSQNRQLLAAVARKMRK